MIRRAMVWCDKKLDNGHKALTIANLLIVNVNAEAVRAVSVNFDSLLNALVQINSWFALNLRGFK